jgi:hypothetical protein
MMILIVFGLLLSLALPWSVGYVLVLHLAPGVFGSRQIELAVSLLLGICVMGVALILPITLLGEHAGGHLIAFWSMPILSVMGLLSLLARYKDKLRPISAREIASWITLQRVGNLLASWSSIAILLIGTTLLIVSHPPIEPTVELYATRSGDTFQISVTSSSAQPQQMILVITTAGNQAPLSITLDPVSSASAPATVAMPAHNDITIELFNAKDYAAHAKPIRQLALLAGGTIR